MPNKKVNQVIIFYEVIQEYRVIAGGDTITNDVPDSELVHVHTTSFVRRFYVDNVHNDCVVCIPIMVAIIPKSKLLFHFICK